MRNVKPWVRESPFYERLPGGRVRCLVCSRGCILDDGAEGFCWNHVNIGGRLYTVSYGLLSAVESRPIEIKPFFHYWPNSTALTFSGWGCNYRCPWCQNYHLSFTKPEEYKSIYMPPEKLVEEALRRGDEGVCASFNEPVVHAEYVIDVAEAAARRGLYATIVTNGSMTRRVLERLIEAGVDGYSIDIKGCPATYRRYLGADPHDVLSSARAILDRGGHVEMVYLVVTGANDWSECIEWVIDAHKRYLGEDVPLHINRYYPANNYVEPPTPLATLERVYREARSAGIKYVYVGNIPGGGIEDTVCPRCGKTLVRRRGYRVVGWSLDSGNRCPRCGEKIPIRGRFIAEKTSITWL